MLLFTIVDWLQVRRFVSFGRGFGILLKPSVRRASVPSAPSEKPESGVFLKHTLFQCQPTYLGNKLGNRAVFQHL
jgi:hypothetical protein